MWHFAFVVYVEFGLAMVGVFEVAYLCCGSGVGFCCFCFEFDVRRVDLGGFTASCLSAYFILVACVRWWLCVPDSGWFMLVVGYHLVIGLVDSVLWFWFCGFLG